MKKANYPFHVLIKPTGPVCNIACEYCFYLEKKTNFRMSEDTLETFVKQYINDQPYDTTEVNFTWQGGEPTLLKIFYVQSIIFPFYPSIFFARQRDYFLNLRFLSLEHFLQ